MGTLKYLSKTKLMRGYRCLKCIYLTVHRPDREAPITPDTQALFDQGHQVGHAARQYYPGGILVDNKPWDFAGALAKTRALLTEGAHTLYEAAFEHAGCYARADIIQHSPTTQRFRIFEVKSSTKVKPEHYDDVALQVWIMAKSGLPIEQINLVHLNPACRYPDLGNLFTTVDITEEVRARYLSVPTKINEIIATLKAPEAPDIDLGPHCTQPTDCSFMTHCFQEKKIPEVSLFNLPGIYQRKWALYQAGIIALDDPRLSDLSPLQERMITCFKTGKRYVDATAIQARLADFQFPLTFLDFETINPAIPRYVGCGPFQHVPFQFSVHTWPSPDAALTHQAFLHDTPDDPRETLIPALLRACGEAGAIVAYFGKFESERIHALADYAPRDADRLMRLTERIVDPLPFIRESVYDPAFAGSFSLKRVAPALLGEAYRYEGMSVANGNEAQRAFERLIAPDIDEKEKTTLKKDMLDYCKQDTMAMVDLVKWLYGQAQLAP